jgi:hypothetical protein
MDNHPALTLPAAPVNGIREDVGRVGLLVLDENCENSGAAVGTLVGHPPGIEPVCVTPHWSGHERFPGKPHPDGHGIQEVKIPPLQAEMGGGPPTGGGPGGGGVGAGGTAKTVEYIVVGITIVDPDCVLVT